MSSLAIIGPGRLGTALGRRLAEAGMELEGFVARSEVAAAAAAEFCGLGDRRLELTELGRVETVFVAVGDDDLTTVVDAVVRASAVAESALWVHTSGFHSLGALDGLRALGARVGVLHPLCPVPHHSLGYEVLSGAPATIDAGPDSVDAVRALAERAGLVPLSLAPDADRGLYHCACALAANGGTALLDLVTGMLEESLESADARRAAAALLDGAVTLGAEHGARAALSGPVVRGDVGVVRAHLQALVDRSAAASYRALMSHAVEIARDRSTIDEHTAASLRVALNAHG